MDFEIRAFTITLCSVAQIIIITTAVVLFFCYIMHCMLNIFTVVGGMVKCILNIPNVNMSVNFISVILNSS